MPCPMIAVSVEESGVSPTVASGVACTMPTETKHLQHIFPLLDLSLDFSLHPHYTRKIYNRVDVKTADMTL